MLFQFRAVLCVVALSVFFLIGHPASPPARAAAPQETPTIIAATPGDFPPQYYKDRDGGVSGFAIDIMDQVAARAGFKVFYRPMPGWKEAVAALQNNEADVVPNLGITPERKAYADFTSPVETFPISIFVREANTDITSFTDLAGRNIGAVRLNAGYAPVNGLPGAKIEMAAGPSDLIYKLLSGRVDAIVFPQPVILHRAQALGVKDALKQVGAPVMEVKRAIAVAKGKEELLAKLEKAVQELLASPEYTEIYAKWHVQKEERFELTWRGWLLIIGVFLAGGALVMGWRYKSLLRLNAELGELSSEFKNLFDNMAQGVVYQDRSGAVLNANPAVEGLLGVKLEDFIGMTPATSPWIFIKEDETELPPEQMPSARAWRNKTPVKDVIHGLKPKAGGETQWIMVSSFPQFRAGETTPYQVCTTFTEVTNRVLYRKKLELSNEDLARELKNWNSDLQLTVDQLSAEVRDRIQIEKKYAESLAEFEAIFDNSQVGIMLLRGGRYLARGNKRLAEILGYDSEQEMQGLSMRKVHLTEERFLDFGRNHYEKLQEGVQLQVEYQLARKDGAPVWCSLSGKALDNASPPNLDKGVLWIIEDISQRKIMEAELRESEHRRQLALDASGGGIYYYDILNDTALWDDRVYEIYGLDLKSQAPGYSAWMAYVLPEDLKSMEEKLQEAVEQDRPFDLYHRTVEVEGKTRHINLRGVVLKNEQGDAIACSGVAMDVTQRKEAERTIADITQKLELAYQISRSGWWEYDVKADRVHWPDATSEIFGLAPGEEKLDLQKVMSSIHPDFHSYFEKQLQVILEEGSAEFQYPVILAQGGLRWIWARGETEYDESGAPLRLFGTIQDITEAKTREDELRKRDQMLSEAQRLASLGSWEWDILSGGMVWSDEAYTIFGESPERFTPSYEGLFQNIHPEDVQMVKEKLDSALNLRTEFSFEHRIIRREGDVRFVTEQGRAYYNENWDPVRMVGTVMDTTELRRTERSLRFYQVMAQGIGAMLSFVDKHLVYQQVNDAYLKAFAVEREDIIGRSMRDFLSPDAFSSGELAFERCLRGEQLTHYMWFTFPGLDNGFYKVTRYPVFDTNLRVEGMVVLIQDLTDIKRTQKALEKAHGQLENKAIELQKANEELNQYAYVVSHDLKSPLRAIHNYADFIREDLGEQDLSDDIKLYLDGLGKAVKQSEALVEDLLELSRIGRKYKGVEVLDLGVVFSNVMDSLHLAPDVEIRTPKTWPNVVANTVLLRQALANVLTNGLKFNESEMKEIVVEWRDIDEHKVDLYIQDNGIGIEEKYLPQIFKVFQRLHTSSEYEGTGIGLAIVKKAMEAMQGDVRAESTSGKGSTFILTLMKE